MKWFSRRLMNKILSCCSFLKDWVIAFPLSDIRFIYPNTTAHINSFCVVSFNVFMNVNITLFECYDNVFKYNYVLFSVCTYAYRPFSRPTYCHVCVAQKCQDSAGHLHFKYFATESQLIMHLIGIAGTSLLNCATVHYFHPSLLCFFLTESVIFGE